nr:helix-turn-helix domain-containing protein [Kitasatospora purpeofusca]
MSGWTTTLSPGLPLTYDGERFTIAEIEGRRVLLQQVVVEGPPRWRQVDLAVLLSHPSTEFHVEVPPQEQEASSITFAGLSDAENDALTERFQHVQEVRFGYKSGSPALALPGEPRPDYGPGTPLMRRYAAKAAELGVDPATVRGWVAKVNDFGPAGLLPKRRAGTALDRADVRWVDMARSVLAAYTPASRPVGGLILAEIEERLAKEYGRDSVTLPGRTLGYQLLRDLTKGTNAFKGSTKGKRSIANRPSGVYGRLRATHPGEYVVLDTTSLDVFAMESVTCRWVRCELTVAMDLYSRCICGLRLTPVSTKSVDVAGVLFETVRPLEPRGGGEPFPYCGVPSNVILDARKLVDARGNYLLPNVAAETIVYDHGKVYVSNHIESVCTKLDISLQPARPYTPTDKPIERWFKTLNQGLLAALPGYKGPDVYGRGEKVEEQAYFFVDELEAIIREWITLVYHRRPHRGLTVPEVPGLDLSPLEMYEHGVMRSGPMRAPSRPGLAFEFLEEEWCTLQHYGVEVNGLRYNGPVLKELGNQPSDYRGRGTGKWPVAVDRHDVRKVYFQHPKSRNWHALGWEHAPALGGPASLEALVYARQLAVKTHRFPDTKRALIELLERWGAGLTADRTERRMAVRLSQERFQLVGDSDEESSTVPALPMLRRIAAIQQRVSPSPALEALQVQGGDDDEDDECQASFPDEHLAPDEADEDDFYADVLDSR